MSEGLLLLMTCSLFCLTISRRRSLTLKCMTFRAPLCIAKYMFHMKTMFDAIYVQRSVLRCPLFFIFFHNFGSREKSSCNQSWQFKQETGKEICESGWKSDGRSAGNRKRTKDARSLIARVESRQSPRFVELALAELSVRWSASKPKLFTYRRVSLRVWCALSQRTPPMFHHPFFLGRDETIPKITAHELLPMSGNLRFLSVSKLSPPINYGFVYVKRIKIFTNAKYNMWMLNIIT